MVWVPCVVANRRYRSHRNKAGGPIVALIILFLLFGVIFFFFFNRSNGFMIPVFPIISGLIGFFIIILIISIIAASISATSKRPYQSIRNSYQYQPQEQKQYNNPYRVQNSVQKRPEEFIYNEIKKEIPIESSINYCRYCGEKVDRDAKFCHQCGSLL
ncbi:MAG: zinc ribbon domain-containing protein [Candidatus Thorarchaeota archaeon]